jgi:hypothetical protein
MSGSLSTLAALLRPLLTDYSCDCGISFALQALLYEYVVQLWLSFRGAEVRKQDLPELTRPAAAYLSKKEVRIPKTLGHFDHLLVGHHLELDRIRRDSV